MKNLYLALIVGFFWTHVFSQTTEVILKKTSGHIPNNEASVMLTDETHTSLVFPDEIKKLKYVNFYSGSIAPLEELFRKYKNGQISYNFYLSRLKAYNRYAVIDTNVLLSGVKNNGSAKVYFISGVDTLGNKVICVDADRNGRISTDEIFTFSYQFINHLKESIENRSELRNIVLKQTLNTGYLRTGDVKINPLPMGERNSDDNHRSETDFSLVRNEYWYNEIVIKNEPIKLYAQSKPFFNEFNLLQLKASDISNTDKTLFDIGDVWSNKNFSFTVDSAKKMENEDIKVYITYRSPPRKYSDTTFYMSLKNVDNDRYETLQPYLNQNKYILIDYWGTWCKPCIAKIPDLKELGRKFENRVAIVSIAYDEDIKAVKDFDVANSIYWNSYFIDRNILKSLIKPLKVNVFPTYRLYNPKGKLIYEGNKNPDDDLKSILNILSNI